jgi:hypothetical protein
MANFNYILSLLGTLSTTGKLEPPGEIFLGPRRNTHLSAAHDTTSADYDDNNDFYHIGWNAEYYNTLLVDGQGRPIYKYRRFSQTEAATALRIGHKGFEVWTTHHDTGGNLDAQMKRVLHVRELNDEKGFIAIPTRMHFQTNSTASPTLQDYRLTFVPFDSPQVVYGNASMGTGVTMKQAKDFNVPDTAQGIQVAANCRSGGTSWLKVLQHRENRHERFGLVVGGQGGGGAEGFVPLGRGSYDGKFVVEREGAMTSVSVYIKGYWT